MVDIARTLPVSRPAVSQHLKVLKDAGLVTDRAVGTRRVYEVDARGLESLRGYFGCRRDLMSSRRGTTRRLMD